jgi:hypothetical protein
MSLFVLGLIKPKKGAALSVHGYTFIGGCLLFGQPDERPRLRDCVPLYVSA